MKIKYLLIVILLFVTKIALPQQAILASKQYPELRYEQLKGEVFYSAYRQVKGNAYLMEDWSIGTIYLKDGREIRDVQFKFDIYTHQVLIYQEYLKRIVIPERQDIVSFTLRDKDEVRKFISVSADLTSRQILTQYFLEALEEGNISLYKLYSNSILPLKVPEMPYIDEFNRKEDYYLLHNGKYLTARLKKAYLFHTFPEHKAEIKKYVKENKLKVKHEDDFVLVIDFVNLLSEKSPK